MEEKEMEKKELTVEEKQLKMLKLQTGILAAMLVFFVILGAVLAGKAVGVMNQAMDVMQKVNQLDLDTVNSTVAALQDAALELQNVDMDTLNKAVGSLKTAAENLTAVDIDAINEGIRSLSEAANNLDGLNIDELNALITSLDTVAARMEKTSTLFGKLFG